MIQWLLRNQRSLAISTLHENDEDLFSMFVDSSGVVRKEIDAFGRIVACCSASVINNFFHSAKGT